MNALALFLQATTAPPVPAVAAAPEAAASTALEATRSTAEAQWHLFGSYFLANPGFLALIPLGILALVYGRAARARDAGRVSAVPAGAFPRSWPQRFGWLPLALHALALIGIGIALARPVRGNELRTTTPEGVDIVLCIDRSGSMQYPDLDPQKTRLEVVKEVVGAFAVRRMTDRVGAADSVALLVFARYPELLCPFTLDAGALSSFLRGVGIVKYEAEDGTAIGRGLAKAVALLQGSAAKSKVVVLLTDGENNVDDITPESAARLASEQGVRVYTVLAGRYVYQQDLFGRVFASEQELDTSQLEQIALATHGKFFRARDRDALERVYGEIERLERTPRTETRSLETFDLYPLFLLPALAMYALAWISSATWARRIV
jgi:Ca-activated chloride channel homolog